MTETLQPQTDMGRGGVPPRIITGVATAALCSECPLLNKGLVEAGVPFSSSCEGPGRSVDEAKKVATIKDGQIIEVRPYDPAGTSDETVCRNPGFEDWAGQQIKLLIGQSED